MEPIKGLTHVALIPDGNRRWAAMKGVSRYEGHQAGAQRMHDVIDGLIHRGVKYLTVWGFSSDNWRRSQEEVTDIFELLQIWIERDTPWLHENGVRLKHIGRLGELPDALQDIIVMAVDITKANRGMTLNLAFNYSGRAEIVDAVNQLMREWPYRFTGKPNSKQANGKQANNKPTEQIDEATFSHYLYTDGDPDVDLVIRTADEFRLSNFMLWQTAYAEFVFTPVFWPDFDALELEKALKVYAERKRRFGGDEI